MNKSYKAYLMSAGWRSKKNLILKKRGKKCERCGYDKNLHVHHKTYKNIFKEKLEDLEVLCFKCHHKEHFGVKIKKIKIKDLSKYGYQISYLEKDKVWVNKKVVLYLLHKTFHVTLINKVGEYTHDNLLAILNKYAS